MIDTSPAAPDWASFAHTLSTVLAAAEPAEPAAEAPLDCLTVTLLAAAQGAVRFPAAGVEDTRHLVSVLAREEDDELWLEIVSRGYFARQHLARRKALLVSDDGVVRQGFAFDAKGTGRCLLRNAAEVWHALAAFRIVLRTPAGAGDD
ncbi:MAG: hypothetical protein RID91_06235 [Azospirillaceae bacterium]